MTAKPFETLLLDEMFSPQLAAMLRQNSFDVEAVAGHHVLAAASDVQVARWAASEGRRVLTENVRDFVPLVGRGDLSLRLLLTSSRRFPRSRRNPGPLVQALGDWLASDAERSTVEWLT